MSALEHRGRGWSGRQIGVPVSWVVADGRDGEGRVERVITVVRPPASSRAGPGHEVHGGKLEESGSRKEKVDYMSMGAV